MRALIETAQARAERVRRDAADETHRMDSLRMRSASRIASQIGELEDTLGRLRQQMQSEHAVEGSFVDEGRMIDAVPEREDDTPPRPTAFTAPSPTVTDTVEESPPVAETPPAAETPTPEVEEPPPVAETPPPEVEEVTPVAETPAPEVEEPPPVAETPPPEVEESPPVAETPPPEVEDSLPVAETPPGVEEPAEEEEDPAAEEVEELAAEVQELADQVKWLKAEVEERTADTDTDDLTSAIEDALVEPEDEDEDEDEPEPDEAMGEADEPDSAAEEGWVAANDPGPAIEDATIKTGPESSEREPDAEPHPEGAEALQEDGDAQRSRFSFLRRGEARQDADAGPDVPDQLPEQATQEAYACGVCGRGFAGNEDELKALGWVVSDSGAVTCADCHSAGWLPPSS